MNVAALLPNSGAKPRLKALAGHLWRISVQFGFCDK
jgi:hypothetical protein